MSDFTTVGGARYITGPDRPSRDPHETSLPMLVLGATISVASLWAAIGWPAGVLIGEPADWPTTAVLALAFGGLALTFRHRAARHGRSYPTGFGVATLVAVVALLPPAVIALVTAGPFLVFGIGLLIAGVTLRNPFLTSWAITIGAVGVIEGLFGIPNWLPASVRADWEHPAIYASLGMLTILAGLVLRIRENHAPSHRSG